MKKAAVGFAFLLVIQSLANAQSTPKHATPVDNQEHNESVLRAEFEPGVVVSKIPARIVRLTAHLKVTNTSDMDLSRYIFRITVPPNLDSQQCIVEASDVPPAARKLHKSGVNEYLEFHFPVGAKQEVIKNVSYKILLRPVDYFQVPEIEGRAESDEKALTRYLEPSEYIESDSREVLRAATTVFKGAETEHEKAKAAYEYPASRLKFKLQKRTRGAQWALQRKTGDCTEYACLFSALCRSQSIPARRIGAFNFSKNKKKSFSSPNHHIAEVHLASHGWIPVDANLGAGKYNRPIGLGKLGNTIVLLNREGVWTWSTRLPSDGYDKSLSKPKVKYSTSWDGEVLKEGPLARLEKQFNSEMK